MGLDQLTERAPAPVVAGTGWGGEAHMAAAPLAHVAGLLAVGSVLAVDPDGWYPFGPTKWLAVSTLAAALVVVAAWAVRRGARPATRRGVVVAWAALLAWGALAAVFGRDPVAAWIGTAERRFGWITWVLCAGCWAAGSMLAPAALRTWSRWLVVAGAVVGGWCLVERWWRAPVSVAAATSRLLGPFGSAAYLGAATCLLLPITVAVACDRDERPTWRWAAGATSWTLAVAAVGAASRAAWIGLAVAALAFFVARRRAWRAPAGRGAAWIGLAAGAGALALVAVTVTRLDDVLRGRASPSARIDEWTMALRAIGRRPLLGAGPEGYRTVVLEVVTAHYERTYGRAVLPDRAHSSLLDVAATLGLPGALAFAALLALVAMAAWRALRSGETVRVGLAAAAVAYLVQQLALFPLAELDPVFWVIAGALLVDPLRDARGNVGPSATATRSVAAATATVALAGAATLVLFVTGVIVVAADRAAGRAVRQTGAESVASAQRAVELRPDVLRYHLLERATLARLGTVASLREAVAAADDAVGAARHDPVARLAAAQSRLDLARVTGRSDDIDAALAVWQQVVDGDQRCHDCHYGLGLAAALAGEVARADAAWERAAALAKPGDERAAAALAALRAIEGEP